MCYCELKAYCQFHYLKVLDTMVASLSRSFDNDIKRVKEVLQNEINVMDHRLDQYHLQHCSFEHVLKSQQTNQWMEEVKAENISFDFSNVRKVIL